jgi:hypothetical protein
MIESTARIPLGQCRRACSEPETLREVTDDVAMSHLQRSASYSQAYNTAAQPKPADLGNQRIRDFSGILKRTHVYMD